MASIFRPEKPSNRVDSSYSIFTKSWESAKVQTGPFPGGVGMKPDYTKITVYTLRRYR